MASPAILPYQTPYAYNAAFDPNDPNANPALTPPPTNAGPPTSIYGVGAPVTGTNTGQYASPTGGIPALNTDPNQDIHNMFYNDQAIINAGGQQINQEAQNQLAYYDPLQQQSTQQAEGALSNLQQTPGYTPGEASQINVNYGQYQTGADQLAAQYLTPEEQAGIAGNPNQPAETMAQGTQAEGNQLNAYQANLGGELGAYQSNLSGETGNYQTGTESAAQGLGTGLQQAQGAFSGLNTAVNNPALAFDPNSTEQQLSNADVQQMKTAAGETVGNQYRTAEDQLQRSAAAAGNTSPLAIAAANARLQSQEASDEGNAEVNADIAAQQAQYQRAAGIEAQREGAVQTQSGMQAGAATTEESAAQQAAALAGTANISAAEASGQAGINAANQYGTSALNSINQYGQTAVSEGANAANQNYTAANTAEQAAAARAASLATNRQATTTGINSTQYGQGVQTGQLTSQGAQATGNARIAGNNTYLQGVTQQESLAQQGGQAAVGQQQAAYGTETGGLNSSTAARAGYETSGTSNSALNQATKVANAVLEKGGIVDEPTDAIIGERGPEMVIPLMPRYGQRKAA